MTANYETLTKRWKLWIYDKSSPHITVTSRCLWTAKIINILLSLGQIDLSKISYFHGLSGYYWWKKKTLVEIIIITCNSLKFVYDYTYLLIPSLKAKWQAIGTLPRRQNPIGLSTSAWCPGGRITATPFFAWKNNDKQKETLSTILIG